MSFLAIETTGAAATVALMDNKGNIYTEQGAERMDHLRGLMPMVKAAVERSGGRTADLEMIAVSAGPGSFTGIRIGVAAAKTLAQVLNIPVAPVVTLYAMACNNFDQDQEKLDPAPFSGPAATGREAAGPTEMASPASGGHAAGNSGSGEALHTIIVPMIDARRDQVYAAAYRIGDPQACVKEDAYSISRFLDALKEYATETGVTDLIFCGDGAEKYRTQIDKAFADAGISEGKNGNGSARIRFAEGQAAVQHAEGVLRAGLQMREAGSLVSWRQVEAVYLRKAEAERKRETGRLGRKRKKTEETAPEQILEMPPEDGIIRYAMLPSGFPGEASDAPTSEPGTATAGSGTSTSEPGKLTAEHTETDGNGAVSLPFEMKQTLQSLAALDDLCFTKSWSAAQFEGDLRGSRKAVYAGAFNSRNELIGFAGIVCLLDEGEVNRVAVHPLYRARGIAGKCLDMAMEQAAADGVGTFLLEVREANRSAISLYKDHGFRVISKRRNYYAETGENALIMQRTTNTAVTGIADSDIAEEKRGEK